MNYTEAIEVIKRELICEKMTSEECGVVGDCKNCPGGTTNEDRIEALETIISHHADKYRWHDLRKNPEDLPIDMDCVQVCWIGGSHNWYDSMFWNADKKLFSCFTGSNYEIIHPIIYDSRYTGHGRAIAWRYIDPFEEG